LPSAARTPACSTTVTSGWTCRAAFPSERQITSRANGTTVAPNRTITKATTRAQFHRRLRRAAVPAAVSAPASRRPNLQAAKAMNTVAARYGPNASWPHCR
jgi:hypothetical protein